MAGRGFRRSRELEDERAALRRRRFQVDSSAVEFSDPPGDRQAEARSAVIDAWTGTGFIYTIEAFEDTLPRPFGDTAAGVHYTQSTGFRRCC